MLRRRRVRDVFSLLWAVLQFALPLAVAYADSGLASDGRRAQPHAEADRSSNCPPAHSPECGLCRGLSNHDATAVAAAAFGDFSDTSPSAAPGSPAFPRATIAELPRSRGPPTA